jgi:hypothetical protein
MPSKSKSQQRFMGLVHAFKKGDVKGSEVSKSVKDAAASMDTKSVKKYASTKHKGKPEKVNKEWLINTIKELTDFEMESCGYTMSAVDPNYKLKSPGGTGDEDKKLKEVVTEGEEDKIIKLLVKYGNTEDDAKDMVKKTYDYIKKAYRKANTAKKAEIMSSLMKMESKEFVGLVEKCWKGYEKKGTKKMFGKTYPNCVKKENVNPLTETTYKGFIKYMNDFYGPKGVYPDKKKRTLKMKDIGIAYSVLLKKKPNFEIGYDSTDREFLRDILIKMKKLDPDYSQKESVDETINENRDFEKLYKLFTKKDYFNLKNSIKTMLRNYDVALKKGDKGAQKYTKQDVIKSVTALNKENAKRVYDELVTAIKKKDIKRLKSRLRHNQPYSIAIFNQVTGKKLPKSTRDIHSFLDNEFMKESVDESKTSDMMRNIRKGGTAGPWSLIVSKNNSIRRTVMVKNLKEIPAYIADLKKKFPNHKIGIEAKGGKIVHREAVLTFGEAVDTKQGTEILNQLGGKRFMMFTGAKHFGVGKEGLSFKIGRNSKQVNHIKIDYDRGKDLYNMKFDWVTKRGIKNKKTLKGVYADQLQRVFSMHTGMATKF